MSDLISRQSAIDAINQICQIDTEYDCTLLDRVDVRCVLTELTSAQPERKKGRWIRMYYNRPKQYTRICSECGEISWFCGIGDYNYCPWCGARMEGKKDETD